MKLWKLADDLVVDMQVGLSADSDSGTKLRTLVSNVQSLSSSDEEGIYCGINLCATEFHLSRVQLGKNNGPIVKQDSKTFPIPSNPRLHAFSEELFDYVATELAKSIETESESFATGVKRREELGFTYSLPLEEEQLLSGDTKSKSTWINDTVGKEVVDKFNKALEKQGVDLHVSAMIDETVGNLVRDRNYNENVVAAITLAMGTNAAYVESVSAISNFNGRPPVSGEMVIDTG